MAKTEKLSAEALNLVARRFKALSDPTRLKILQTIWDQEWTVHDIVRQVETSQVNVSKHLGILHDAGLVTRRKEGLYSYYRIADPWVLELCNVVCDQVRSSLENQIRTLSS